MKRELKNGRYVITFTDEEMAEMKKTAKPENELPDFWAWTRQVIKEREAQAKNGHSRPGR